MTRDEFLALSQTLLGRPNWDFPPSAAELRSTYLAKLWDAVRDIHIDRAAEALDQLAPYPNRPSVQAFAAAAGKRHEGTYRDIEPVDPDEKRLAADKLRGWRERVFKACAPHTKKATER